MGSAFLIFVQFFEHTDDDVEHISEKDNADGDKHKEDEQTIGEKIKGAFHKRAHYEYPQFTATG